MFHILFIKVSMNAHFKSTFFSKIAIKLGNKKHQSTGNFFLQLLKPAKESENMIKSENVRNMYLSIRDDLHLVRLVEL